jgi:hypothetical protein
MNRIVKNYDQAWPLCWQLMQWDLVLWASIAKSNTHIHVVWNEATLQNQIAPTEFQQTVHEFKQVLTEQLGGRLKWIIDTQSKQAAHLVQFFPNSTVMDVTK